MNHLLAIALLLVSQAVGPTMAPTQSVRLPNKPGTLKFAVIGDSGQLGGGQSAIAAQMLKSRANFPFEFVLMMGDNLYGGQRPNDYDKKFAVPYKPLIDAGVKFYASLGNHDDDGEINYKLFNMEGRKYYSFKPKDGVRFFAIDSNYVDTKQLEWLEKDLAASGSDWKIAFFHHPLYSSGATHGSADAQRELLEPLFIKHGVNVVLSGHEHFYERLKPQKGIAYFIIGSSSKLRKGDLRKSTLTAYGNDAEYAFMLVEIDGDNMNFQTINDKGVTIDTGVVTRPKATTANK
jgi:3',5'-cyclic AMP phosphodiesterase CpdA